MKKLVLLVVLGVALVMQAGCCRVSCMMQNLRSRIAPCRTTYCCDPCEDETEVYVSNEVGTDVSDLLPPPPPLPIEDDTETY